MRFTIREVVLVTAIVALGAILWRSHSANSHLRMILKLEELNNQKLQNLVELAKAPMPSGLLEQQLKADAEKRDADMVHALTKRIEKEKQRSGIEPD
jgi:hypothetical protein